MACIMHDLQEDDTPTVYVAAVERAEALGYEVLGPMHETYYPAGQAGYSVTEVQFPIRRVAAAAE